MDKWFVYFNYNPHKGFIFLGCIWNDQYAQDHAKVSVCVSYRVLALLGTAALNIEIFPLFSLHICSYEFTAWISLFLEELILFCSVI